MPVQADWQERHKSVWQHLDEINNSKNPTCDPVIENLLCFERLMVPWTETLSSWSGFHTWIEELEGNWCFRGQREAAWDLTCTLDRGVQVKIDHSCSHLSRRGVEDEFLFRFQQQAHQYISNLPAPEDKNSWFALMQHHGVPTRLLDWTMSPYVALFFALEVEPVKKNDGDQSETENDGFSAIWAINRDWLKAKMPDDSKKAEMNGKAPDFDLLRDSPIAASVVEVTPHQINQRMTAQQGLLLMKLVEEHPRFDEILASMLKPSHQELNKPVIRKLKIHKNHRIEFLQNLREMNMHHGTLFPGLDGFCRSLKADLEIEVAREKQRDQRELDAYNRSYPVWRTGRIIAQSLSS